MTPNDDILYISGHPKRLMFSKRQRTENYPIKVILCPRKVGSVSVLKSIDVLDIDYMWCAIDYYDCGVHVFLKDEETKILLQLTLSPDIFDFTTDIVFSMEEIKEKTRVILTTDLESINRALRGS